MKAVDITLIIQAINFFIAYWFLKTYVFYPAMKIITKEESQEKDLRKAIDVARSEKEQIELTKKSRWDQIKESLHRLIPSMVVKLFSRPSSIDQKQILSKDSVKFSKQQREKIKKVLTDSLLDVKT